MKKKMFLLIVLAVVSFVAEGYSRHMAEKHQESSNILSGMISLMNEGAYRCMLPWHMGRKLEGYKILGHDNYECQWDVVWVDWKVVD